MTAPVKVRFLTDGEHGGWTAGDTAVDLGWESTLPVDDEDFVPMRLLRTSAGEVLALHDPFRRRLIEVIA